jgi:hypothetical protein
MIKKLKLIFKKATTWTTFFSVKKKLELLFFLKHQLGQLVHAYKEKI